MGRCAEAFVSHATSNSSEACPNDPAPAFLVRAINGLGNRCSNRRRLAWKRARRMIRKAVQGVAELERLYAEC